MLCRLTLALVLAFVFAFTSCQSYSTGLQQTVARADETGATAALKAIEVAQRTYSITNAGEYGTIQQLTDGGFLDARFSSNKPVKDYIITVNVIPKSDGAEGSYTSNADPDKQGAAAGRHFYLDSTSTNIHVNATQPATAADPLAQ